MRRALGRRAVLTLAGLPPLPALAVLPASATVLVPGPEDAALSLWAGRLCAALARGATTAVVLQREVLGGPDGVTAANRFATVGGPDGRMLLVLPGAAAQARLVGDPRARFDGDGAVPVCAAQGPALLCGRGAPGGGGPVRVALPGPDSAVAAALLGLDLLGIPAVPLLGQPPEPAFAAGAADALVLRGPEVPERLAALGARPWFVLDAAGQRDPALPEVPSLGELTAGGPAALRAGFLAAAANARLVAALLLPALTPGNLTALWRGAAQRWLEEEQRAGLPSGIRALAGPELAPVLTPLAPPAEAVRAYRGWLQQRLGWRAD